MKLSSSLLNENPSLASAVLRFLDSLPLRLSEIKQSAVEQDRESLAAFAHKLAGAGSFGYLELGNFACSLKRAAEGSSDAEIECMIRRIETICDDLLKEKKYIESLADGGGAEQSKTKKSVLLIEDDADVRMIIRSVLETGDYIVYEAENGAIGLEKLAEVNPSLIILDYMMPVMDGKEFLKEIKTEVSTANIPVIVFTAVASETNSDEFKALGADDFIKKGVSPKELFKRIEAVLA